MTVIDETGERPLDPRFDLRNHSPSGFEWNYSGSGPAQLALAMLADALGDEQAQDLYQSFKARVIARLDGDRWEMTAADVQQAVARIEAEQERTEEPPAAPAEDRPMPGSAVPIPVPPDLFRALGSHSTARYAAFWVDADSDDMIWNDGVRSGNCQPWVFKEFLRHRAVEPILRPFDLTSHQSESVLVFDQEKCRASVCKGTEAADFLRQVRPPLPAPPPTELSPELQRSLADFLTPIFKGWQEEKVDPQAVQQAMAEQQARVRRMISWLDMAPVRPSEGRGA